jgi:hypothetical protein
MDTQKILQRIDELKSLIVGDNTKWIKHNIASQNFEWGQISDKKMNQQEAEGWCKKQGGRLPTMIELLQAYKDKIPGFKSDRYWSSTTYAGYTDFAWFVGFYGGGPDYDYKTNAYYVRCVRGQ